MPQGTQELTDSLSPAMASALGDATGADPADFTDGVDVPQDAELEVTQEDVADGEVEEATSEYAPELLSAAGLSEEEAAATFGSPTALAAAVRMMDQRFLQAGQQLAAQHQTAPPRQPAPQAVTPPEEFDPFEFPEPSDGQEWDDDTRALVTALHKHHQAELKKRDAALAMVMQDRMEAQRQAYINQFDGFVNSLGDDYAAVLGKGTFQEIKPGSVFMQNRAHLDSVAAQYAAGRRAHGQPELPTNELLARSLLLAFPEAGAGAVRRQALDQVSQRQRMVTARPSQRRASKLTAEERAIRHAEEFMRARGMAVPTDNFDYEV